MDGDETPTGFIKNLPPQEYYEEINDHPEGEHLRSSSQRHKERRDSTYGGIPSRELAKMLIEEEEQSSNLKRMLTALSNQYREVAQRADDADRRSKDIAVRLKATIETKLIMEQDLARVNEELRLYKIQLEKAQMEIFKAQSVLTEVDLQRVEAENAAARARDTARKLKEQRLIELAREEGRRIGLEEGLARGRTAGYNQGRAAAYAQGHLEEATMEEVRDDDDSVHDGGSHPTSSVPTRAPSREQSPPKPPSNPSRSTRKPNPPAFTDAPDRDVPIPPPVTTPARTTTPQISPPVKLHQTLPVVIPVQITRTAPSPIIHKKLSIPPDTWIPLLEEGGGISLPPPNQFSPQLSLAGTLPPPVHTVDGEPILTVRPPSDAHVSDHESAVSNSSSHHSRHSRRRTTDLHVSDHESSASNSSSNRPYHARRRSSDSQASTTISNLDIVSPPKPHVRDSLLTAITEERSSAVPSPNPDSTSLRTASPFQHSNLFHPPTSSPQSILHRSSSQSSEEYKFNIEPPSRPMSKDYPPEHQAIFSTGMLSADDAAKRPHTPQQSPEPPAPQTPVVDKLPIGFMPFTPGGSSVGLPPPTVGSTVGSQLPGGTPGYSYHNIPGPGGRMIEEPDSAPVIPNLSGRSRKSSTKSGGQNRKPPSADSDEVSSELESSDSLTTPPSRGKTPLPIYAMTPSNVSAATSLPPLTISSTATSSSVVGSGNTTVRDSAPSATVTGAPNPGRGRGGRRKR